MRQRLIRRVAISTTVLGLTLTAVPAVADAGSVRSSTPIDVSLTVEGPDGALFAGDISTTGHDVTTDTGGTHTCDGTNGGQNPDPGATPTAALDDAAVQQDFTWDGAWYASFDDFSVDTIKDISGGATAYWNISVNGTPTPVGGCQFLLAEGDEVAFTWTAL